MCLNQKSSDRPPAFSYVLLANFFHEFFVDHDMLAHERRAEEGRTALIGGKRWSLPWNHCPLNGFLQRRRWFLLHGCHNLVVLGRLISGVGQHRRREAVLGV